MKSNILNSILLIILILCSNNFFELQILDGSSFRYIQFSYIIIAILISLPYLFPKREAFVFPVQLISISVIMSIFIATLTRDQSLIYSIQATIPVLVWVIFFYLIHIQFPIEKIEKIVVGFGILYLMLYFFQFTHPDTGYFYNVERIQTDRGITRIVLYGRGAFYLSIFIAINKFTTTKKNLWFWTFLLIMGIVVTIMQVTRILIFATFVIYFFHFLKDQNILKKIFTIIAISSILLFIVKSENPIILGLREAQEKDNAQGAENIRVQEAIFYLTDFSKTTFNRIFGNGVPYPNYEKNSSYTEHSNGDFTNDQFWFSDVGLIGVYAMFGIFAILGYILIWIKSFVIKVPKEYFYLKYYLWYLIMTCMTSDSIYGKSDLITTVFVIYIYQTMYHKYKLPVKQAKGYVEFEYPSTGILNWE